MSGNESTITYEHNCVNIVVSYYCHDQCYYGYTLLPDQHYRESVVFSNLHKLLTISEHIQVK